MNRAYFPLRHSLWAATAVAAPHTDSLQDALKADVIIVGAGYCGLSTALHLAEQGVDVVLLEAQEVGFGGSGRNGGQVIPGLKYDPSELLVNRVAATAQSAVAGEPLLYRIEVPAGASMLSLRTYGGNGTAAVYAAHDRVPSAASNDYRSVKPGTAQTVQIIRPAAGTWYLTVIGDTDVEGLSVVGLY